MDQEDIVGEDTTPWTPAESADLYGLEAWGSGYFGVSPSGTVEVYPEGDPTRKIDLLEVVEGLSARDLHPPVVVRLSGVLAHRMSELRRVFDEAIAELLDPDGPTTEAIEMLLEAGDQRFVAVLLELMRAQQIGLIEGSYEEIIDALEQLSGQQFGNDWPA